MLYLLNRKTQIAIDLVLLAASFAVAVFLRFEGAVPSWMLSRVVFAWPYVVGLQYLALMLFGVHRVAWRYFGLRDLARMLPAMATSTLFVLAMRIGVGFLTRAHWTADRLLIPYGAILIDSVFAFVAVTGVRVFRRALAERFETGRRVRSAPAQRVPTILIGAGRAGVLTAKEIADRPDLGIDPVGFLDDDTSKHGSVVHGVPVLGRTDDIATIAAKFDAKQALITIAEASGKTIRRIVELCDAARVPVKIVPGLFSFIGDKVNISIIRNVAIEDLLRREPVVLDLETVSERIRGRSVLVTGAGGSIGSELCRQVARFEPKTLVLVERAENNLFQIDRELRALYPDMKVAACVADICDAERLDQVFKMHQPSIVYHAAAHKHVPMMEENPGEAVKNNIFGTKTVADIAHERGVEEFVMISTDKAVKPSSVMGASKRAAEIYIQALSQRSRTRFVAVRFGNVLGSTGSVVPIFQDQIAKGGPITITDPEMKRYFMTIPEATQLVIQAACLGRGGEIFILNMGEPVRIVDLAKDLITLSGLRPHEDIEIVYTGVRPGEKLFEELSTEDEQADSTRHPKIFIGRIRPHAWNEVSRGLGDLETAATSGDGQRVRAALKRMVPEYGFETQRPRAKSSTETPVALETQEPSLG